MSTDDLMNEECCNIFVLFRGVHWIFSPFFNFLFGNCFRIFWYTIKQHFFSVPWSCWTCQWVIVSTVGHFICYRTFSYAQCLWELVRNRHILIAWFRLHKSVCEFRPIARTTDFSKLINSSHYMLKISNVNSVDYQDCPSDDQNL